MLDVLSLIDALMKPAECFHPRLPSLRTGRAQTFDDGRIALYAGGFGYTVRYLAGDGKELALKFFKRPIDYRRAVRYRIIAGHFARGSPSWFVPVVYLTEALRVGGEWIDCLAMPWREGDNLASYMAGVHRTTPRLVALTSELWWLFIELRRHRAAPLDSHPGNFRVDARGRVFLLDYDSLFVPGLETLGADEPGMRTYVCPNRPRGAFGPESADFALWLIYASAIALLLDPSLLNVSEAQEDLLFTADDFLTPDTSSILRRLRAHLRSEVRELAAILTATLSLPYGSIPSVTLLPCPSSPQDISAWLGVWRNHCTTMVRRAKTA